MISTVGEAERNTSIEAREGGEGKVEGKRLKLHLKGSFLSITKSRENN